MKRSASRCGAVCFSNYLLPLLDGDLLLAGEWERRSGSTGTHHGGVLGLGLSLSLGLGLGQLLLVQRLLHHQLLLLLLVVQQRLVLLVLEERLVLLLLLLQLEGLLHRLLVLRRAEEQRVKGRLFRLDLFIA